MFLTGTSPHGLKLTPTEFWDMTPPEFFLMVDTFLPGPQDKTYAGRLTQEDVDELKAHMHGTPGTQG